MVKYFILGLMIGITGYFLFKLIMEVIYFGKKEFK